MFALTNADIPRAPCEGLPGTRVNHARRKSAARHGGGALTKSKLLAVL